MTRIVSFGLTFLFMFLNLAIAVQPDEVLNDPLLERRARNISKDIRCLVCQNQSIDDSNAELARDLRVLVRERLTKGDTDVQVFDYLVKRYGDFVLLKPPVKMYTYALWFGPIVIFLLGICSIIFLFRNRNRKQDIPALILSEDERSRVATLLNDQNDLSR